MKDFDIETNCVRCGNFLFFEVDSQDFDLWNEKLLYEDVCYFCGCRLKILLDNNISIYKIGD